MQVSEIMPRLELLFRDFFEDPEITLTIQTNNEDILDWDSLAHVRLILAVEKEFGCRFESTEIANLNNVGGLAAAVASRI